MSERDTTERCPTDDDKPYILELDRGLVSSVFEGSAVTLYWHLEDGSTLQFTLKAVEMTTTTDANECSGATDCYRADSGEIKSSMATRRSVPPEHLTGAALRDAGCLDRVAILPEPINERASYLADLLVQMLTRIPEDDQLRATVGQICQALSYMVNSSSWRDGKLHDFDKDELRRKLSRFAR